MHMDSLTLHTYVQVLLSAYKIDIAYGHQVPSDSAIFSRSCGFVKVQMFLEPDTE